MMPHRTCGIDSSTPFVVMALMFDITAFIRDEYLVFHKDELSKLFTKFSAADFKISGENKLSSKNRKQILNNLFPIF